MTENYKDLEEIVRRCYSEFCLENGIEELNNLEATSYSWLEESGSAGILASLSFAGDSAQGTIYLGCSEEFLNKTHPMVQMGAEVSKDDLKDWSGEICNQLVGRLKNILLKSGVQVSLSVPQVFIGSDFSLSYNKSLKSSSFRNTSDDTMFLAIYSHLDQNISLSYQEEENVEIATEGDAILF